MRLVLSKTPLTSSAASKSTSIRQLSLRPPANCDAKSQSKQSTCKDVKRSGRREMTMLQTLMSEVYVRIIHTGFSWRNASSKQRRAIEIPINTGILVSSTASKSSFACAKMVSFILGHRQSELTGEGCRDKAHAGHTVSIMSYVAVETCLVVVEPFSETKCCTCCTVSSPSCC